MKVDLLTSILKPAAAGTSADKPDRKPAGIRVSNLTRPENDQKRRHGLLSICGTKFHIYLQTKFIFCTCQHVTDLDPEIGVPPVIPILGTCLFLLITSFLFHRNKHKGRCCTCRGRVLEF
jgi:hypothetical protein